MDKEIKEILEKRNFKVIEGGNFNGEETTFFINKTTSELITVTHEEMPDIEVLCNILGIDETGKTEEELEKEIGEKTK